MLINEEKVIQSFVIIQAALLTYMDFEKDNSRREALRKAWGYIYEILLERK